MNEKKFLRFPTMSIAAEYLAMGYLLRRNVLVYKAPPMNEGYDLIAIHPDPRAQSRQLRIQVKSRYATDHDWAFPCPPRSFDAFDYLVAVFLNIGHYLKKAKQRSAVEGRAPIAIFTFPAAWVRENHNSGTAWERLHLRGKELSPFEGDAGIEQIARDLSIEYPARPTQSQKVAEIPTLKRR
jgi:hypothetical protein